MPAPTAPYPLLSDVLDVARSIISDVIVSNGGQTFKNTSAFTPLYVNHGWQAFQQFLVSLGYTRFLIPDSLLLALAAVSSVDTSVQVTLDWTGYNNGGGLNTGVALPQNLVKPVKLAERISAAGVNQNPFIDMDGPEQGITRIPAIQKDAWHRMWTWNNDQISTPGAVGNNDLRIDFESFLPDFTTGSFPGTQVVPIMRSTDALAGFIAYHFDFPRGDADAATILANAQDAARIIAGVKTLAQAAAEVA